jgi:hypothetical protein
MLTGFVFEKYLKPPPRTGVAAVNNSPILKASTYNWCGSCKQQSNT